MKSPSSSRIRRRSLGAILLVLFAAAGWLLATHELRAADADVVDFKKLLPLLPEAPAGWTADKPEGDTTEASGFKMTSVHRDYTKGEGDNVPSVTVSILDASANQEYIGAITGTWSMKSETTEGYAKGVTIDGNAGFETYENEGKHGTLWTIIGKRFLLEIETRNADAKELQEWVKRIDLKKLADVK
jgi:hypothetical protein